MVSWSAVLVAALIATLVQVVVSPQAAAAPKGKNPRDIPLMLSKAVAKPSLTNKQSAPEADFTPLLAGGAAAAGPVKSGFDPKTSKESARTEDSVEFTNANGTKTVVLSQVPVSVRNSSGGWDPIDTRLVERKDSKRVTAARTGVGIELAEFANDPNLFRVNQNGTPVTLELKGAGKASRKVTGSTATYANALPNTDVTYEVSADAIKESIILKSASAVGEGRWVFKLNTGALTPKVDGKTVKISDKTGKVLAALPPIEVWDSAGNEKDKKPSARTGGDYSLARDGEAWQLTVAVDKKWLKDSARKFPVVVDPTYTFGFGGQAEAIAYRDGAGACSVEDNCGIRTGNSRNFLGNVLWRSAIRYDLAPLAGKTVTGARMDLKLFNGWPEMKPASQVSLYQATTPLGFGARGPELASGSVGEAGSLTSPALTTYLGDRVKAGDKNTWLMLGGTETNTYSFKQLQAALIVDYGDGTGTNPTDPTNPNPGPEVNRVAPGEDSVIATDMPVLEVSQAAAGVKYCFKISTGFDGRSGSVVDSGCLSTPKWTVPEHVLRDGARYSWTVATVASGATTPIPSKWVGHFTVDKRIGNPGPAPTEQMGPVTVNLFNGNLKTHAAGPLFEAMGGSAGVTFSYNSRQGGEGNGVRASYFNDADHNGAADTTPVMVRNEAQVNLDWGNIWSNVSENSPFREDPMPTALDKQWFVVRWEGYFRAPVTGDFSFAGSHADGAKIWIDDNLAYDNQNPSSVGTDFSKAAAKKNTDISLNAGQRVPLKIELYHRTTSKPQMVLWAKSTTGASTSRTHNWNPQIVKTESLFAQDPAPLPGGWTLGLMGSEYVAAEMLDGSVVLTDTAGGKHGWTKASAGGYTPPKDEDGVLAVDAGGRVSVTKDGAVSVFNVDGTLAAVSKVSDSKKPASLQYLYSGTPARLTQIKDPVSGRAHTLYYNTDNSDKCYGGASLPPGTYSAPAQKLCRIKYWDGTETRLWYIVGALGRIENPGSEIRDYSYLNLAAAKLDYDQAGNNTEKKQKAMDAVGSLDEIRDSLAVDWRAGQGSFNDNTERTLIEYDAFRDDVTVARPPHSRVIKVTAPAADGRSLGGRMTHGYRYDIPRKTAHIDVAGINKMPVYSVTWDDAGRQLTSTDAVGDTVRSEWNAKDKPTATVDTTGRRTTVAYDHADRPTDEYGPAPGECFNGQFPTPECAATMPHTRKSYDENLKGLEAAFYDNPFLAGVPKEWGTGVGTADGSLKQNWGPTPPVANSGGWSGRFMGEVKFPATGEYKLGFTVVDGVRLWIDDVLVVDSWTDKAATAISGTYTNITAGSWHRVRVDYYNRSGTSGALDFTWTPPGTGSAVTVPGQNLAPRYGLETSQIAENTSGNDNERAPSKKLATSYSDPDNGIDPVFGLTVSRTADPGGINLTGRMLVEKPGQGYLRQLAASMPAGELTNPDNRGTFTYYGDSETRSNPCKSNSEAANQGGRVKTVRGPKNSDGLASVLEKVYDGSGRVVAVRTNSEPWSCVSYDTRGRIVEKSFPAMGDQGARAIIYDYAVDGNPLKSKVSDNSGSTTSMIDLLGRIVSYMDAGGVTTTSKYDTAGRKISETTAAKGVTSTLNHHWDDASRLTGLDLDGARVATPGYTAGILDKVAYGNGSNLAITHNDAGSTTGLTWKVSGSTVASTVTRSRDQRITDETITDTAGSGTTYNSSYTYDGVGRLVAAAVPHHKLTYSFAGDNGCGPNKKAGLNTNRTAFTDSFNGAPATTTNYCYDDADRLLSTNGATTLSFTYDTYGNATKVGTDTLGYDSTLRHISTTTAAGRSVAYTRDVTDRITTRTVRDNAKPAQVTRYGFTTNSSGPDFVLDDSGTLRQRVLKLPGGALLTKSYTDTKTANWSYPNTHGDILFTADGTATRTGALHLYDPYGQNIDPATGAIGDIPIPATAEGGMDFGYLGQHTVPIEHVASQQALEMGARTYLPVLGRFLQVDPILGGSANNYDYVNADPINSLDLTGEKPDKDKKKPDPSPGRPRTPGDQHGDCSQGCMNPGEHKEAAKSPLPSTVSPDGSMLGSKGAQTTSKTLGEEKSSNKPYWRIDVENPNPGRRPGQLHLQTTNGRGNDKDQKYQYNFNTKQFEDEYGAPPPRKYLDDISKDPNFDEAIRKGGRYLGVPE
ncbi:PA14 domain-containing protein [Nocardia sp. XZ_19_369]|uniref:PA14 domain-containing protein n=1 Tax=Nocardia sp. XZ_19_369 TaxID=2769487 RepID=UPI00188F3A28|nr:PA14 domain-containing protein [Nocardia sp. XZ_19_369]